MRIEVDQGFIRFPGHIGRLRPGAESLCEAGHTGCAFFTAGCRERFFGAGIGSAGAGTNGYQAMGQLQSSQWRVGQGERLWLSTLVDAMERVSRSPRAADTDTLAALRAQLALPAQSGFASPLKLLN